MNILVSKTQKVSISSSTRGIEFFNLEDINYQLSVLEVGIHYMRSILHIELEDYTKNMRIIDNYNMIHGGLQWADVYQAQFKKYPDAVKNTSAYATHVDRKVKSKLREVNSRYHLEHENAQQLEHIAKHGFCI